MCIFLRYPSVETKEAPVHFDFTDLRLFLAILESGSITAGAVRSHLALASASARIRGLEAAIGTPLLVRSRAGVRATPAGEAFGHHARMLLQQAERLREDLARHGKGLKGHLRIWSNTAALSGRLPRDLARVLAAHPDVDADLEEHPSAPIARALREGLIHVGVLSSAVGLEGLDSRAYDVDRLMALLPEGHPLSGRETLAFRDVVEEPFVGLATGIAMQDMIAGEAARLGVPLKLRVRATSFAGLSDFVAAGVGVAVLPETEVRRLPPSLPVRALSLSDAWTQRALVIAVRDAAALPDFARKAFEALDHSSVPPNRRNDPSP